MHDYRRQILIILILHITLFSMGMSSLTCLGKVFAGESVVTFAPFMAGFFVDNLTKYVLNPNARSMS